MNHTVNDRPEEPMVATTTLGGVPYRAMTVNHTAAGYELAHDCLLPTPTLGASSTCPDCGTEWFTALSKRRRWVWVNSRTGEAKP